MAIDNIINKFERPTDLEVQRNTRKKSKIKTYVAKFFGSRWMGLVIGPAYGAFLYLYVTHLILGGAPFTNMENVKNYNKTSNTSVLSNDSNKSLNVEDEQDFEPLISHQTRHAIGIGIGGGTGIGLTIYSLFSEEVRCSMVLMVPSLLTKRGRGFMLTFVASLLIEGPIDTIEYNLQEVVRSFTCMFEQMKSLAERFKNQFQMLMKQFKEILKEVEIMANQYRETMEKMMKKATEDQKRQIREAKEDLESQGRKIKEAAKKVSDVINAAGKVITDICSVGSRVAEGAGNLFTDPIGEISSWGRRKKRNACKVPDVVTIPDVNVPHIGIEKLQNILKVLKPDLDLIDLDYKTLLAEIDSSSIKEIRNTLKAIFKEVLKVGKLIANWWSKIFYLTIIFVALDAVKYQRQHFADDDFDNMLIDDNLKKAWRRDGKRKLTPLRKWEVKERYQIATSIRLSKKEAKKIVIESISTIMMTIIILGIVMADWVFTKVLQTFQDNAKFGLSFPGMEQGISFGSMIGGSNAKLNILKIEAFDLRADPCLPQPKSTPPSILVPIVLILLFCAFSCIIDAYACRLKAIICNFFSLWKSR
eukprot:GFUD01007359.1.p1 GENE.GFUD01007359.1~~GFUD01007359.1.p1  ORF type:complete len:588 (+),score=120.96 GFUD01007359.1:118-1881(+)